MARPPRVYHLTATQQPRCAQGCTSTGWPPAPASGWSACGACSSAKARTILSHGSVIYDERGDEDPIVKVETLTAGLTIADPEGVEAYRNQFARLRETAVYGDAAQEFLARVIDDIRRLQP